MSSTSRKLLKIIENWPQDKSKTGRDLGEQIVKHLKTLYNYPSEKQQDIGNLTEQLQSLERLSDNYYLKKYRRLHNSTATGLSAQQCNQVLSSEFLQYLSDSNKPF